MPGWPAGAPQTIGLLGDSTTVTDYLLWADRYTEQLRGQLRCQLTNYAVAGRQTSDYLDGGSTPPASWLGEELYLVRFGFNDGSNHVQFGVDTHALLDEILSSGARAVLATNYGVDYAGGHYSTNRDATIEARNVVLRQVAVDRDVPLLDLWTLGVGANAEWDHRCRNPATVLVPPIAAVPPSSSLLSDPRLWDNALDGDGVGGGDDPVWYRDIHPHPAGCANMATITANFLNDLYG